MGEIMGGTDGGNADIRERHVPPSIILLLTLVFLTRFAGFESSDVEGSDWSRSAVAFKFP